jgi:hypothetical protein
LPFRLRKRHPLANDLFGASRSRPWSPGYPSLAAGA